MHMTLPKFNLGLYQEGLRQLRITGIIGGFLTTMLSVLILISREQETRYMDDPLHIVTTETGSVILIPLVLCFIAILPVMLLQIFGFTRKRNASDFYHALPHTRPTIYLSFLAAVFTYLVGILLVTFGAVWLCDVAFCPHVAVTYDNAALFLLYCLSSCVLVSGAGMIAISATGNLLNNILLAAVILFLPRFFILFTTETIESNPVLAGSITTPFLSPSLNPIFALMMFFFEGISTFLTSGSTMIYGVVLGFIYLCIGCFLFARRKSETATKNAPSPLLQSIYRILLATAMCSLPIFMLFNSTMIEKYQNFDIIPYIAIYLIIILLYFLYELLATKKLKSLVKAIPGLGIVAVLNVAMYFGLTASYQSAMHFRPAAEEIECVRVIPDTDSAARSYSFSYYEYILNQCDGVSVTDADVLADVSYTLNSNLKTTENHVYDIYTDRNNLNGGTRIAIQTADGEKIRTLFFQKPRYERLMAAVVHTIAEQQPWKELPKTDSIYVDGIYEDESKALYEQFCKELPKADMAAWFADAVEGGYGLAPNFYFHGSYLMGNEYKTVEIPVYAKYFPETVKMYNDFGWVAEANDRKELVELFSGDLSEVEGSVNIDYYQKGNCIRSRTIPLNAATASAGKDLTALVQACSKRADTQNDYIAIGVYIWNNAHNGAYSCDITTADTKAVQDCLNKLMLQDVEDIAMPEAVPEA